MYVLMESLVVVTSHFETTQRLFWDGPRSDDELKAPLSKLLRHTRGRTFCSLRMIYRATGPIHDGSSVESGFEPRSLRLRGRHLNTKPPRPLH
ncbi:hypothetical protein AVEN_4507-1 [Araneus ventricosus]|uniref:Uncharacterized protein n=1 Tax=Araneus ventricosus TaxID=182803 RepID=A0A4Y2BNG1_ARAVE|nr:hypothetical protein AVEN_4507-1 [Araneus ventricosus]